MFALCNLGEKNQSNQHGMQVAQSVINNKEGGHFGETRNTKLMNALEMTALS